MVVRSPRGFGAVVLAAAQRVRGLVRRQFLTRNRRLAFVLAVVVAVIGTAAGRGSGSWFSPGGMILPLLAGGRLLGPRAPRGPFLVVGGGPAECPAAGEAGAGGLAPAAA